ncbi:MAG: hypothetical protein RIQ34_682 [Bacteroidota bacterium]
MIMLKGMFARPENGRMYWREFMHQCSEIGIGSLGIVAIISVFIGAVSTIQTAYQLVSPLIPLLTIAQIVRDTVILEFAPTLVCIVLAGVAGSRIASELGNMRVSEQIDALEIMGINSRAYLILPKIVAALIMIPLLVVIAMVLGIWGGRLAGTMAGIIPAISSIPAYYGYYVRGGALEIGRASTKAVVVSCVLILFADYILSALLL